MHTVARKVQKHLQPHGSLGHLTPSDFATMRSGSHVRSQFEFKTSRVLGELELTLEPMRPSDHAHQ